MSVDKENLRYKAGRKVVIRLDAGDLILKWDADTNHIFETGPDEEVFTGK